MTLRQIAHGQTHASLRLNQPAALAAATIGVCDRNHIVRSWHIRAKVCPEITSFRSTDCGNFFWPRKTEKISRVEYFDGAAVPLYYFEAEGSGWSDYQDDDGIELLSDAKALAYAYTMIGELKADREGINRPLYLLVKNAARKTIFRIAFE